MGMTKEFMCEPCIKLETIYEESYSNVYGCEGCNTTSRADEKYCAKCGSKHDKYQKQSEYVFDFWHLTNDEMYNHQKGSFTYLFSNVKLDVDIELHEDEPLILDNDYIEKSIKSFKEKHKLNIKKISKLGKEFEVCFVVLERWT